MHFHYCILICQEKSGVFRNNLDALTVGPAQVLHLDCQIQEGSLANLCIFDLNQSFTIEEKDLKSKSANTPFLGAECYGRIFANIVNGEYNDLEEK